jgi:hypothetical protein
VSLVIRTGVAFAFQDRIVSFHTGEYVGSPGSEPKTASCPEAALP